MHHTFREDELLSLQRMPGQARVTHAHPSTRNIDPTSHTAAHPFCCDPACSCHRDLQAIEQVNTWVQQGLMTPDEATNYILGRTL